MKNKIKISAVILNYNYENYLEKRIKSILNQTVKPAEIIFLDDVSTDKSVELAETVLKRSGIPYKIIVNTQNQGVFKQWLKAIEVSENDILWIAEADDYCESQFLEKVSQSFEDEKIVLAYCQSKLVRPDGSLITLSSEWRKEPIFDRMRFTSSFINDSRDEVRNYMGLECTVPNVSSVLFRKSLLNVEKLNIATEYKLAGDWIFYIQALLSVEGSKIRYIDEPLNYFVRHKQSVHGSGKNSAKIEESMKILLHVMKSIDLNEEEQKKVFQEMLKRFADEECSKQNERYLLEAEKIVNNKNDLWCYFKGLLYTEEEIRKEKKKIRRLKRERVIIRVILIIITLALLGVIFYK